MAAVLDRKGGSRSGPPELPLSTSRGEPARPAICVNEVTLITCMPLVDLVAMTMLVALSQCCTCYYMESYLL